MARLAVQREDRRLPDEARSQGGLLRSQSGRWGRQDRPSVKGGLLEVWRDTRQLVLAAQVAAIYAAVLIPFKVGIPIIPGFVELRPANAIPVVASLLFGPAAAWGAAFGNLIGDLFGTLGPGSLFGLLGNFLYGYVPYRLWGRLGPLSSGCPPEPRAPRQILEYALICILASLACAGTIGWGLDVMRLLPFQVLAPAIFINNVLMSSVLGPPLLLFLYPRVARWGLLYADGPHDRKAAWAHSPVPAQAQLVSTNVERELAFTLGNLCPDLSREAIAARITDTLRLVGLDGHRARDPLSLSGGERQRLAIASVLAPCPPVLVLDDPATDLDPAGRGALYALLRHLVKTGTTVVLTDHETEDAVQADQACLLSQGGLVWDGRPDRLLRRPALLEQCDVRPLPLSAFFARLGYRDELPLTPEEAVTRLKGKHVQIEEPTVTAAFPDPVAPVVIEARAVEFVYPSGVLGGNPALDHVDLTVRQGECIAIVGANGSGKTTLAKLFKGLLVPTRGEGPIYGEVHPPVEVGRRDSGGRYRVQTLDHPVFADTVSEEIAFGPSNLGGPAAGIPERVREALEAGVVGR